MADEYLKLYRIKECNVWPYEDVASVTLVERNARAILTADFKDGAKYRCYRHHPDQFVELAPMEAYAESWEGADDGREISPYQLLPDRPLALQIEYVLFQSWKASDQIKLQGLIENIKNGTLTPQDFPQDIRPARVIVRADDESHPWQSLRLEGKQPPTGPTSAFFVCEHSENLPYINHHTIPKGIDYEFVQAAVVQYGLYKTPPKYGELLKTLDKYCSWFEQRLSETPQPRARKKRGRQTQR